MSARPSETLNHDQLDRLGKLADTCDNFVAGTVLPMPDAFHLKMLKSALTNLSRDIKTLYVEFSGGENPWE